MAHCSLSSLSNIIKHIYCYLQTASKNSSMMNIFCIYSVLYIHFVIYSVFVFKCMFVLQVNYTQADSCLYCPAGFYCEAGGVLQICPQVSYEYNSLVCHIVIIWWIWKYQLLRIRSHNLWLYMVFVSLTNESFTNSSLLSSLACKSMQSFIQIADSI